MSAKQRIAWPVGAGLAGALFLATLYLGIVSLAESPQHAVNLFWQDRLIVVPVIPGFGVQMALYVILKKCLFVPITHTEPSGALAGASSVTSTMAMVACCAHHLTDVLPILGLRGRLRRFTSPLNPLSTCGEGTCPAHRLPLSVLGEGDGG